YISQWMTQPPEERTKAAYGSFQLSILSVQDIVSQAEITGSFTDTYPSMEEFSFLNNGSGQTFGYVYYTTKVTLPPGNSTLLIRGHVRDKTLDFEIPEGGETEVSILLENLGRVNYGEPHDFVQKKGIWEGAVYVNLEKVPRWDVTPLEFKKNFVNSLTGWQEYTGSLGSPTAYRSIVTIEDEPQDTFLDMSSWNKGVVFVNGFNLGRYWTVGPTHTLYIPVPLLIQGDNEVSV
ncbi:Beta-galactosidase-1-like protein 2, partial [Armadillidium vulgare]